MRDGVELGALGRDLDPWLIEGPSNLHEENMYDVEDIRLEVAYSKSR